MKTVRHNYKELVIVKNEDIFTGRVYYTVDFDRNCEGETYNKRYKRLSDFESKSWTPVSWSKLKNVKSDIDAFDDGRYDK